MNLINNFNYKISLLNTKKVIGTLLLSESVNMSIAHFEIHHVIGSKVTCLNPTLWISH